jgi:transposase
VDRGVGEGAGIETAKLRGEDPGRYLLRAALAAIENPGTVTLPSSAD